MIQRTRVPIARPMAGGPSWMGVAHRQPRWTNLASDDSAPEDVERLRAADVERPLFEWVDGVQFSDRATGIVFEVVPGDDGAPRHYSETAVRGSLPADPPPVSRVWLNERARMFLREHAGPAIDMLAERPAWLTDDGRRPSASRLARPDDVSLVALVRLAYDARESPRQMLAAEFGVSANTADVWVRRARTVAAEQGDPLPEPTRGRPRRATITTGDRA